MATALGHINALMADTGCTVLLVNHNTKNRKSEKPHDPPELSEISGSGWAESRLVAAVGDSPKLGFRYGAALAVDERRRQRGASPPLGDVVWARIGTNGTLNSTTPATHANGTSKSGRKYVTTRNGNASSMRQQKWAAIPRRPSWIGRASEAKLLMKCGTALIEEGKIVPDGKITKGNNQPYDAFTYRTGIGIGIESNTDAVLAAVGYSPAAPVHQ